MIRSLPRRYLVVLLLAVLAVLVGVGGSFALSSSNTSAKDRIAADPPPRLFAAAQVSPLQKQVEAQTTRAQALMRQWWAGHGRTRDDQAFEAWLERTLPGPPSTTRRTAEVAAVQRLAPTRTHEGVAAATWLEAYGKKDLWKLYAHDQAELVASSTGDARKKDLKDMLKMSKTVADKLGLHYRQSAPYVLHPDLRPDHTVTRGQVCPCSYPSRHAAAGAAATAYLGGLDPERLGQYQWTEAQIDYSRVYMAGHVTSDVTGGALLGEMIGEYFLSARS